MIGVTASAKFIHETVGVLPACARSQTLAALLHSARDGRSPCRGCASDDGSAIKRARISAPNQLFESIRRGPWSIIGRPSPRAPCRPRGRDAVLPLLPRYGRLICDHVFPAPPGGGVGRSFHTVPANSAFSFASLSKGLGRRPYRPSKSIPSDGRASVLRRPPPAAAGRAHPGRSDTPKASARGILPSGGSKSPICRPRSQGGERSRTRWCASGAEGNHYINGGASCSTNRRTLGPPFGYCRHRIPSRRAGHIV